MSAFEYPHAAERRQAPARTDLLELMATLLVSDTVTKAQMSMSSSSSHETPRWRGKDSNPRSPVETSIFETAPEPGYDKPAR
jgi:hypothetical protein